MPDSLGVGTNSGSIQDKARARSFKGSISTKPDLIKEKTLTEIAETLHYIWADVIDHFGLKGWLEANGYSSDPPTTDPVTLSSYDSQWLKQFSPYCYLESGPVEDPVIRRVFDLVEATSDHIGLRKLRTFLCYAKKVELAPDDDTVERDTQEYLRDEAMIAMRDAKRPWGHRIPYMIGDEPILSDELLTESDDGSLVASVGTEFDQPRYVDWARVKDILSDIFFSFRASLEELPGRIGPGFSTDARTTGEKVARLRNTPDDLPLGLTEWFPQQRRNRIEWFDSDHSEEGLSEYDSPCRLALVPKTYFPQKMRTITMTNASKAFAQQCVRTLIVRSMSMSKHAKWIDIHDQARHHELLRQNWLHLGTIDLSRASDLLSWEKVSNSLPSLVAKYLEAVRDEYIIVGDLPPFKLSKFAGMGNASLFPVQTAFYYALLRAHLKGVVSVYGDDIIVSEEEMFEAAALLHAVGLEVNLGKSFSGIMGFVESCGLDLWQGHEVTPIRRRFTFGRDTLQSRLLHVEHLRSVGLYRAAAFLDSRTHIPIRVRKGKTIMAGIPRKLSTSTYPGWVVDTIEELRKYHPIRWNPDLQRLEVKVPVVEFEPVDTRWLSLDDRLYYHLYKMEVECPSGKTGQKLLSSEDRPRHNEDELVGGANDRDGRVVTRFAWKPLFPPRADSPWMHRVQALAWSTERHKPSDASGSLASFDEEA